MQIFEIFECSGQNSSNSSCRFWTDKSIPLQFLHHSSLSWHITPLKILSSYIFNFRHKYAIKVPIWRLSNALVKICQIPHVNFWKHKPVFLQTSYQSWVQSNIFMFCTFLAQTLYNLVKSRPWKCKFLRLLSSRVKIRQIRYVNFETTRQLLFRFFTTSFFSVITYNFSVSL